MRYGCPGCRGSAGLGVMAHGLDAITTFSPGASAKYGSGFARNPDGGLLMGGTGIKPLMPKVG